jgi:hypothetical protein
MIDKKQIEKIYVALLNEGVDVWRPVEAEKLQDNVYRIIFQPYDSDIETWQFSPGDEVICEIIEAEKGPILAAIRKAFYPK